MDKSDQQVSGDGNQQAMGDIYNLTRIGTEPALGDRLRQIDERVANLLPDKMLSPRSRNRAEDFSADRLIQSLAKLGMPISVGLMIAEAVPGHIPSVAIAGEPFSTAHLRRAILRSIYGLDRLAYGNDVIDTWGDAYARRYGNPTERLKVIDRDEREVDLDYPWLMEHLLPHIIENVLNAPFAELVDAVIKRNALRRMAEAIMELAKGLNVYAIRYKTLYHLAYDLAVQPPHPWFAQLGARRKTVDYDLDRAQHHAEILKGSEPTRDVSSYRHSCKEAAHHACSAIMAHYGAFLGSSPLGSIGQLIHSLSVRDRRGNRALWEYCEIRQIDGDLRALGHSHEKFLRKLETIRKDLLRAQDEELSDLGARIVDLVRVAVAITSEQIDLPRLLTEYEQAPPTEQQLLAAAREVMIRIPGIEVFPVQPALGIWFHHDLQSVLFRDLRSRILLWPLPSTDAIVAPMTLQSALDDCLGTVRDNPLSSALVIVSNRPFHQDAYTVARRLSSSDGLIFLMSCADLRHVASSKDRLAALCNVLMEH